MFVKVSVAGEGILRHRGNPHRAALAVAERVRRAADRLHPPRMPRSHHHHQRTRIRRTVAAYVEYYLKVANALGAQQGCAGLPFGRRAW